MRRVAKRFVAVWSAVLVMVAMLPSASVAQGGGSNPRVIPPQAKPYGMTLGEWSAEWWKWIIAIPADSNPGVDDAFAGVDQEGPVWFLAGLFGTGEATRSVTVPAGKALLIPIYNWVWWAPDDLATAEAVADHLGYSAEEIAEMTEEELIRLLANYAAGEPEMTCTVNGRELTDLLQYHAESPAFSLLDTDLLDDFGVPISQPNLAVASGYWIMLAPLPVGEHTIHLTTRARHSIPDFDADLELTYQITVTPGR